MTNKQNLSDSEQEELKALQDERKATEGHMSDSRRIRLSELLNKQKGDQEKTGATTASVSAAEQREKDERVTGPTTAGGTTVSSKR